MAASGLLDTAPQGAFDDLAQLALAITGAQKAFFTVADGRRSFWKSALGVDPAAGSENDMRDSPCHILVGTGRELIAENAARDPRIKDLGAVADPGVGAWAGYPVFSPDGHMLGGFCVVDRDARPFTPPDPGPADPGAVGVLRDRPASGPAPGPGPRNRGRPRSPVPWDPPAAEAAQGARDGRGRHAPACRRHRRGRGGGGRRLLRPLPHPRPPGRHRAPPAPAEPAPTS
ncbi:GAF domain-containing protein [Kitasatospora sp. SolWspMP-SS2h]|uniref:GAF domain-containing protein n=1 Tax=Kitasatospora sp. SolWspMP-SS2h TaxID=1305729 RepID=UPI00351A508B